MKKLIFTVALTFVGLTAFAQETDTEEVQTETTEAVEAAQDGFSEVAVEELPEAVTAAVEKNYPTATINKAHVNEAKQYKLEVSLEDGTSGVLFADENGNWIEQ